MRFFTRLGIPAPRETHTRLYVNGSYAGLYGLVESVDKTMMGRVFGSIGDNVQNDGYLFEYNYVLGSPWRFAYEGSDLTPYKARFDIKTNESHAESHDLGADRRARPAGQQHRRRRSSSRPSARGSISPAFVRYIAAQNFIAAERRLQRLRRDEQFLHLPAREQHQPRVHRVG